MIRLAILSLFTCLLIACNGNAQQPTITNKPAKVDQQATSKPFAPKEQTVEAIEKMGKPIELASFNKQLKAAYAKKEYWTNTPLLIALKIGGEGIDGMQHKAIDVVGEGENPSKLLVTITNDGLLDDSIKGNKIIIRLTREGRYWRVEKATRAWRCQAGRGHEDYSSQNCQ